MRGQHWLFAGLAIAFAAALFNHSFVPSMEPRFAEAIREMLAGHAWLVPVKNGRPYVEYPPLYYWLGLMLNKLGLPMTAAIRLPAYLSFFGWLVLLAHWQKLAAPQWPRGAFALVAASMPIVLFQFAIAQTDGLLAFGVMLAMYGYLRLMESGSRGGFPWQVWLGVMLASLAKGPVGIVCTLPIFALELLLGGARAAAPGARWRSALCELRRGGQRLHWKSGLCLTIAVNAAWYVVAAFAEGVDFVRAVLWYQNVDRYLTGFSHLQPWWYYGKTILYDFFPVSLLLPLGALAAWRGPPTRHARLALLWAVFTLLFFSVSASKQGKYLLPAAPAFVALAMLALDTPGRVRLWVPLRRWAAGMIALCSVLLIGPLTVYGDNIGGRNGYAAIAQQLEREPGELVHFGWPRSLTLYELGAPMAFVRSSRELYARIRQGNIPAGSYVLVENRHLGDGQTPAAQLLPWPDNGWLEPILETTIGRQVTLLRVRRGAAGQPLPATPEPLAVDWRDREVDTD